MDSIAIRYGENLTLPIDTGDITDVSADIFIGKPGEVYVLTKNTTLVNGVGTFVFSSSDTEIPLDTYYYQINTTDSNGYNQKYPSPETGCDGSDDNFPQFIVAEALDKIEVS